MLNIKLASILTDVFTHFGLGLNYVLPGRRVLVPTKNAMTSVKVVTDTATPACFIVCPNLQKWKWILDF